MPEKPTKRAYHPETVAVHGGYEEVEPTTRSRVVPIYQTTSYTFKNDQHAADLFSLKEPGNIYTRLMNPTNDVLEKRIAQLEGGIGALVVSSGQSAEFLAIMQLLRAGDELVAGQELYGGTRTLFEHTLARFGVKATFFDPNSLPQLEKAITPKTKAVFIESLPNPSLVIPDIEAIATIAHEHRIPLIVDNTVASPVLLNPINFGADIVVHSTTKYISGHGYSLGGVIVDSGKFPWNKAPHFKDFDAPDPTYHGLNFWQAFGSAAFIAKARVQLLRDLGPAASPFNSWLALIGLETLPLRMERICSNAQKIAEHLKVHPKVAWVNYPGLRTGKDTTLLRKYLPRGYSGIIGVGLRGGYEAGKALINNIKIFSHLANIGDAKSLIIHPASTTHQQLEPRDQLAAGVTPEFIRLSIGIEHVDDLIEDLDAALAKT